MEYRQPTTSRKEVSRSFRDPKPELVDLIFKVTKKAGSLRIVIRVDREKIRKAALQVLRGGLDRTAIEVYQNEADEAALKPMLHLDRKPSQPIRRTVTGPIVNLASEWESAKPAIPPAPKSSILPWLQSPTDTGK